MRLFKVINPADDTVLLERPYSNQAFTELALQRAEQQRKAWRTTPLSERQAICRKAVDYLVERAESIGQEISAQMGRPIRYSPKEISGGLQERAGYMIDIAESALMDISISKTGSSLRFIRREPIGTVLVLAPWNYPFLTSVNVIIPALLAGNCVILKHALQTPLCAERYAEAFAAAGLPEGVFQYLFLDHDQTAGLIQDPRIHYVAFTGSVAGGHAIQQAIGSRFITAGLELGGKDPAYVRADADLEFTIEQVADGAFFNSGQSCCGIERVYVDQAVYQDFVDGIVDVAKQYQLGSPMLPETTLGPMVRTSAAQSAREQIRQAVAQGAQPLVDPALFPANRENSAYLAPQVLIKVDHNMTIMQEETFAPVVGIMPVKNEQEAIRLMNDSRYGLTASIWTKDAEAALRIGDQLETGTCFLNRCDYLDPALAWTGVKDSGKGCTLSGLGYEALTRPKSFHFKY